MCRSVQKQNTIEVSIHFMQLKLFIKYVNILTLGQVINSQMYL